MDSLNKTLTNLLISCPGERHEDMIPQYFISLDNLENWIDEQRNSEDLNDYNDSLDFYVNILIPNKPVKLNGNDCDFYLGINKDNIYINYSKKNYEQLLHLINKIKIKKNKLK